MTVILTLGGVLFSNFEVPETMPFGGNQTLVTHKKIGGARTIDAMGRDDVDITWNGRFLGGDAEIRARLLDAMRVVGQPVELAWSGFRYTVVIAAFKGNFNSTLDIPYSITCMVVEDKGSPIVTELLGIDALVGQQLNQLLQIAAALNLPSITKAIAAVETATSAVQSLQGAGVSVLSGVQAALGAAGIETGNAFTADNATVTNTTTDNNNVAGMVAGGEPIVLANTLTQQTGAYSRLGQLTQVQSGLGLISRNLSQGI